jgi:hypothetical protein
MNGRKNHLGGRGLAQREHPLPHSGTRVPPNSPALHPHAPAPSQTRRLQIRPHCDRASRAKGLLARFPLQNPSLPIRSLDLTKITNSACPPAAHSDFSNESPSWLGHPKSSARRLRPAPPALLAPGFQSTEKIPPHLLHKLPKLAFESTVPQKNLRTSRPTHRPSDLSDLSDLSVFSVPSVDPSECSATAFHRPRSAPTDLSDLSDLSDQFPKADDRIQRSITALCSASRRVRQASGLRSPSAGWSLSSSFPPHHRRGDPTFGTWFREKRGPKPFPDQPVPARPSACAAAEVFKEERFIFELLGVWRVLNRRSPFPKADAFYPVACYTAAPALR